jgi:hypothetical protein
VVPLWNFFVFDEVLSFRPMEMLLLADRCTRAACNSFLSLRLLGAGEELYPRGLGPPSSLSGVVQCLSRAGEPKSVVVGDVEIGVILEAANETGRDDDGDSLEA